MKIGILGAGISGLSIARMLSAKFEVEVLEKNQIHGGIARTKDVNGIAYHTVGGHCFNSKHEDVLNFVFDTVLPRNEWNKIKRDSKIKLQNYEVDYPIEFSIKQIYEHDQELAQRLTFDFIQATDDGVYASLDEWFRKKFGNAFAEEYFIPYNTKVWNKLPKEMSHLWVEDKLPMPNKKIFFDGLMNNTHDSMSHFEFYYPKSNNQNTFIDALAKNMNVQCDYDVTSVAYNIESKKWIVNNEKTYDFIINTTPLNKFVHTLQNTPENIKDFANKLKANGISNVLWETKPTSKTWTYIPDKKSLFHRYIHIGSFFRPSSAHAISEVIGQHPYEEMTNHGRNDDFLVKPLSFNNSDLAYVVFDDNYLNATTSIKDYLNEIGVYTLGRFGEWQYYNMDICMKKAIDLAEHIIKTKSI
ncbi:MAG: hypothetical protein RL662_1691 [Bacteroidota bacterium]|jgi:protoporphyrinogen oxidase